MSAHATSDGRPVASRLAAWEEVRGLVNLVGRHSGGVFEITPADDTDSTALVEFPKRLQTLALESGVPITFGVFAVANHPGMLPLIDDTVARGGADVWTRPWPGACPSWQSFKTRLAFDVLPEWNEVRSKPLDEQSTLLRDPQVRARLVQAAYHRSYGQALGAEAPRPNFDTLEVYAFPVLAESDGWRPGEGAGRRPGRVIQTRCAGDQLRRVLRTSADPTVRRWARHPSETPERCYDFFRRGAHVSQIADASIRRTFWPTGYENARLLLWKKRSR